jgi:uncharacterized protein (TIGR02246 family)
MVGTEAVERWIEAYKKAWMTDDPADITALFTEDAEYHTGPFDEPWGGRDTIVEKWIAQGDSKLEWDFRCEVLGIAGDLAIVEGWTTYTTPEAHTYNNLWIIQLEQGGRARSFREWWIEDPRTIGSSD